MKDFSKLKFKGTFRDYQTRVLQNANTHLRDGKIHIVAAPGSGKTILGLELIRGLKSPALVLSPSVTIRQQWGERFCSGFLPDGEDEAGYISYDLKQPGLITSVTYQALYAAWNKQKLNSAEESEEGSETADFTGFDLIETVKKAGIRTICLDEAHHLRSEWQRSLEAFIEALGKNLTMIALTATPPYDSTPAEWKAYHTLCGDIDDEIFVPHLVAQKTLCPHQDYIIFSYPTDEEQKLLTERRKKAAQVINGLPQTQFFAEAAEEFFSKNGADSDFLYENYDAFATLITLANQQKPGLAAKLPLKIKPDNNGITQDELEAVCQLIVSNQKEFGEISGVLEYKLKNASLIHRGRVNFSDTELAEKTLISSMGKLKSIADIAEAEEKNLGAKLRMLVLTDFIGQAHMNAIGGSDPITSMGAVQIFEHLRRSSIPDLAVLTGAGVILPEKSLEAAQRIADDLGISFTSSPTADTNYCRVNVSGSNKNKVALVTEAFSQGIFRVLIGTKSLLGEGWDSPCINSLILASFVGSFMLSNQMRGRAIRTDKNDPEKASNIFHLVTLDRDGDYSRELSGADYLTVKRRFDTFLAPAYHSNIIESGTDRLDVIKPPFDEQGLERINSEMYALAADRETMKQRWNASFTAAGSSPQIVDTAETKTIPLVFSDKSSGSAVKALIITLLILAFINILLFLPLWLRLTLSAVTAAIGFPVFAAKLKKAREMGSALGNMKIAANAVCETLKKSGAIQSQNCFPVCIQGASYLTAALENATTQEQDTFKKAIAEMFSPIDNPRYLICKGNNGISSFACPSAVGNKKENAEYLASILNKTAKDFRVVYTRSEKGRQELLKCKQLSVTNNAQPVNTKRKLI